jgi:hypothetical protein
MVAKLCVDTYRKYDAALAAIASGPGQVRRLGAGRQRV